MNLRSRVAAGLALAAIAALAAARVPAQTPPQAPTKSGGSPSSQPRAGVRESASTDGHLVGHEEAELLRRIQELIDDFDPRKLVSPYVEAVERDAEGRPTKWVVKRPDLAQFIQDADAAVALGKAFFWEMQAGSDFRRLNNGTYVGTACASCHYRFGADPRDTNTVRIPYVGWDGYDLDEGHQDLGFGEKQQPVDGLAKMIRANQESRRPPDAPLPPAAPEDAAGVATLRVDDRSDLKQPIPRGFPPHVRRRPPGLDADDEADDGQEDCDDERRKTPLSLIVGSQGVEPRIFTGLVQVESPEGTWWRENSVLRSPAGFRRYPQWSMFLKDRDKTHPPTRAFRQITTRNAPSVMNSTFADRLFHDSRAESTFNGFSIFGDFDKEEVLYIRRVDARGRLQEPVRTRVAIPRAALASQAVGPIVNDVEMSYVGRTFHDLAYKLLDAPVLGCQMVSKDDSVFGRYRSEGWPDDRPGLGIKYRDLIQKAFRPEWCDENDATKTPFQIPLLLTVRDVGETPPNGTLMQADFSLYWGLSLMLYQSTLISNESPYDRMLRGSGDEVERLWRKKRSELEPIYIDRVRSLARSPENCIPGEKSPVVAASTPPALPPAEPRFEFKSGPEVFQRGLRSFLSRGCVDCHDGPLFSEVYLRADQGENEPLKPLPIGRLVSNALLPDSRGDALAFRYVGARDRVLERIGSTLADGGKPLLERELLDFVHIFERHGGNEAALGRSVRDQLLPFRRARHQSDPDEPGHCLELAKQVAKEWTRFEKTFVERLGNRHFFREDERVARAGQIGVPVMVELMPIPRALAAIRPRLPIGGPLARGAYAFYDVSNYAIGAGLPRYDRGGGEWTELNAPEPEYPQELVEAFKVFLKRLPGLIHEERVRVPGIAQADLEKLVEGEIEEFDRMSLSKYGIVAPRRAREAVVAMARTDENSKKRVANLHTMVDLPVPAQHEPSNGDQAAEEMTSLTFSGSAKHSSAGAPGRAYQMGAGTKTRRARGAEGKDAEKKDARAKAPSRKLGDGPWKNTLDADADARAANPRDLSWHRNLPNWNNSPSLGTDNQGFDSVDVRRADVHFFARSRAMVQDESPEGRRKPLLHDNELAFWGSFKTPTLRNVALTAPYMHNGRLQSLVDVVDFYDCGGDVPADPIHNPDLAPALLRLHMDEEEKLALVFFLMCLTDGRVEHEKAPFDHPSLRVVNGYDDKFDERIVLVKAVGAGGAESSPKGFPDHSEPEQLAPPQP